MDKTCKIVSFSHHELLELLAVVRAIKTNATEQHNKAEARLMADLTRKLLDFDVDAGGATVKLDSTARFSLWMCMETYIKFCTETQQHNEYVLAVTIASKLSV